MSEVKTTVLMSVYQKELPEHFDASLRSILDWQSVKPDEFVLVCDGPLTEELENVIAKYKKLYNGMMQVYRLDRNMGLGKALNYGLEKCHNEIIIRADSDDISVPDRIRIQKDYLNKHSDISVVGSFIDEFEFDYHKPKQIKRLPLMHDELALMAKFRNPLNHMTVAFRKADILSVGSYNHIPYLEDYELWVRTIINGYKIANIDKILVHARIGNGMLTRRGNKEYIKSWYLLNRYMINNHMINAFEFLRNMLSIIVFVYSPNAIKTLLYKFILRD